MTKRKSSFYIPYTPTTWVIRFLTMSRRHLDAEFTPTLLRERMGISRPSILLNALKYLQVLDDANRLTELGRGFVDPATRTQACREIIKIPPYDEFTSEILMGNWKTRKDVERFIEPLTGWKGDAVDKSVSLFLFVLKNADLPELRTNMLVQNAQTTPRKGTRRGKSGKSD